MKRSAALLMGAVCLLTGVIVASSAAADDVAFRLKMYCYAVTAMGSCDGLQSPRTDAETLAAYKGVLNGEGVGRENCQAGMDMFWDDSDANGDDAACAAVWDRLGPEGSMLAGLVGGE